VPTWRGWCVIVLALVGTALLIGRSIVPFLSITDRVSGGVLVVEGWMPDHALAEAAAEFRRHHYDRLYVTGVPIDNGAPFSEYHTHAEFGAAILRRIDPDITRFLTGVPAPFVRQDRTYTSAVALKQWMAAQGGVPEKITVVSLGPHARRTRLLYEKAFGARVRIGTIALEDRTFDPQRWWSSSPGVKTVFGEVLGYTYTRFLFWPKQPVTTH